MTTGITSGITLSVRISDSPDLIPLRYDQNRNKDKSSPVARNAIQLILFRQHFCL